MKKLLVLISILFYALWRINSPFASPLNWDIWEHQTVINAIRRGTFAMLPSQLSDTFRFDGYTTLFHVIIAGIQNVLNIQNILGFWWVSEGIFFVLTTLAAYAFVYAITKNKLVALAGGVLSAGLFESAVAFTTLFLLPQTVAALLWVVGMTVVTVQNTTQKRLLAAALTTLVILPIHWIVGALGAMFIVFLAVAPLVLPKKTVSYLAFCLLALFLGYLVPTYVAGHFALTALNSGEALYFDQSLAQKLGMFRQWYAYLPIPFLLLGMWKAAVSQNNTNRALIIILAASVGLLASPFPYVLKFVVIIRYIMIAVIAIGIGEIIRLMTSNIARYIALSALTIAVGLIFLTNTNQWKNPVVFRGTASHVSGDELTAATFLKDHYGRNQNAFLVSDPATQYILEPLAGINSQGGAYMTAENRQFLLDALQSNTDKELVNNLSRIQDALYPKQNRTMLLAINSRTITWLTQDTTTRLSIAYNVWRPDGLSLSDTLMIQQWRDRFGLREVYRNPSIVVFEIGVSI